MLAAIVDIRRWLRDDRRLPERERVERDRAIGRELGERQPVDRVLAWWRRIQPAPRDRERPTSGERVEAGRRVASVALALLGVLLGVGVAGVVLTYDGRYPVNLFTVIGVLVGLPLLMLIFTLLLLPGRVPGLAALQSVAGGLSPGRWIGAWLDRLLDARLFAPGMFGPSAARAFSRWQLVVFSQWLALGFFAGALAIALLLVTFTDLAFGWSTTLDVDPSLVTAAVSALAAPWAQWLPAAAPDAALVEASRYYRLEEGRMALERVERLGGWWPFVLMTVLVYGALPRLLLLVVGAWRLRRATVTLLLDDPEVTALLDRLDAPVVELRSEGPQERVEPGQETPPPPREAVAAEGLVLVIWNAAADVTTARGWLADALGVAPAAAAELGILQSQQDQRHILERLGEEVGEVRRVILVTKGWEPPLLEFGDFVALLREMLGAGCSVTVVPLDTSGTAVRQNDRDVWARALARLGDPRLYVVEAGP